MSSSASSSSSSAAVHENAAIKAVDMPDEMVQDAVDLLAEAIEKLGTGKRGEIAAHVKKEFDARYSPSWHCIVGQAFGSYVTHETKSFVHFSLGQVSCLLFKA
eukprot:EC685797.1.p1 GENE.EC685797.1~~EC685797.1.p1  ORF type:complete len:103 (+),score=38.24 EC685797.1:172-480(+)